MKQWIEKLKSKRVVVPDQPNSDCNFTLYFQNQKFSNPAPPDPYIIN